MPWVEESGYDYEPDVWNTDKWGYLVLRNPFVSAVKSVQFIYPVPASAPFTIPPSWIRIDKKAGHIRFVPTGSGPTAATFSAFILAAMYGGRLVPQMIQVRYTAGLPNAAGDYPDLLDLVKKMAILRAINSAFPAQSGSISADGLSMSSSIDAQKWQDTIDASMNHLRDALHGVRCMVL
jgi:hypothetical protein